MVPTTPSGNYSRRLMQRKHACVLSGVQNPAMCGGGIEPSAIANGPFPSFKNSHFQNEVGAKPF